MAYPESSAVSAGDPTHASHYNNLRLDALYCGMAAADAAALGSILERYETRLTIEKLAADTLRVPASATAPVSVMIDGYLCQAVANVDLQAGEEPAGAANAYYIFANRAAASTTFTLTVSTSNTESANQRLIGRFYWDSAKILKDSVRTDFARHISEIMYFTDPQICDGRLTNSSGVPVPTTDVNDAASIYFTPYKGSRIALYVQDYGWRLYEFSELQLVVTPLNASKVYDIFIYDNEGTLTLSYCEWSNDTLRATNITRQNGVFVKSGAEEYRYLGTIRLDSASKTNDSDKLRNIWNFYNRVPRRLLATQDANSWTLDTDTTWRLSQSSTSNKMYFVIGVDESLVEFEHHMYADNDLAKDVGVGIGLDSNTANVAQIQIGTRADTVDINWYGSIYKGYPGIGYHFVSLIELNGGAGSITTFYGDKAASADNVLSGGIGTIKS